ncbi:MAG: 4Fe-4S binding protein, partial [Alphaproteobacteria bacterium]|nr:4Fe-4S binding protein [Alphaproteobacteria bacterium]
TVAVLRCQGTCKNAPAKVLYDEMSSCRIAARVSVGETGCPDGCLHLGDCVKVCKFGALSFDAETEMPVVDADKCVSCGACVKACPCGLFEIRPFSKNGAQVYVACRNKQKGTAARKNCSKACIGCMKCSKINEAVRVEDNLSYIPLDVDADKCGAELSSACPTGAIVYKERAHD